MSSKADETARLLNVLGVGTRVRLTQEASAYTRDIWGRSPNGFGFVQSLCDDGRAFVTFTIGVWIVDTTSLVVVDEDDT